MKTKLFFFFALIFTLQACDNSDSVSEKPDHRELGLKRLMINQQALNLARDNGIPLNLSDYPHVGLTSIDDGTYVVYGLIVANHTGEGAKISVESEYDDVSVVITEKQEESRRVYTVTVTRAGHNAKVVYEVSFLGDLSEK
ncbi:hypothetical protein FUAX_28610 [Fulvitalea axinellae]|uniref:Uncharacterized protein n=1 Tax=Fulvitalea axinellae TaxID=1182444 RepID=A0AAU9D7C3_9BACT|nr:hypothetical protein FUAX_28610 [Fulvitalea axinellae]